MRSWRVSKIGICGAGGAAESWNTESSPLESSFRMGNREFLTELFLPLCTSERPRRDDQHIQPWRSVSLPREPRHGRSPCEYHKRGRIVGAEQEKAPEFSDEKRRRFHLIQEPVADRTESACLFRGHYVYPFRGAHFLTFSLNYRLSQQHAVSQQVRNMATEKQSRSNCSLIRAETETGQAHTIFAILSV